MHGASRTAARASSKVNITSPGIGLVGPNLREASLFGGFTLSIPHTTVCSTHTRADFPCLYLHSWKSVQKRSALANLAERYPKTCRSVLALSRLSCTRARKASLRRCDVHRRIREQPSLCHFRGNINGQMEACSSMICTRGCIRF